MINVAIDGPAGAGKSTIARGASKKLGFIYVDTGALYRAVALSAFEKGIVDKKDEIIKALPEIKVTFDFDETGTQKVYLNGRDVSADIRKPEISMAASKVSKIPEVRSFLLSSQRDIAKNNNIIMDGRDIGTVVLPHADVKIFLTASPECRAKRRYKELIEKGENVKYDDVLSDVNARDYQDSHREIAPLKPAEDSILFDTSDMNLDESVKKAVQIIKGAVNV